MAVSRVCYVTREMMRLAGLVTDDSEDARVDRIIQATARQFESDTRTWFIPRTEAKDVTVPVAPAYAPSGFWAIIPLPAHLQSASAVVLHTSATASQALTVTTQYRFSPDRVPYDHIEIAAVQVDPVYGYDVVTGWAGFRPYLTITGVWGHSASLVAAGTLNGDITDTATELTCSRGDLVGVGDSILIGTEQMLIADRVITERLSVLRAQGGTTAAAHLDGDPISVYVAPDDVRNANIARGIATMQQELAGYGRVVGTGEGARPYSGKAVADEWHCATRFYRRGWTVA